MSQLRVPGAQELSDAAQRLNALVLSRCSPEERLRGLAPEERLRGLAPEERLRGLAPEERLRDLSPLEKARLLKLLLEDADR